MGKSFYVILYTILAISLIPFAMTLKKVETVRQANIKNEQIRDSDTAENESQKMFRTK